jgi:iron complex outermembrane receptor protein
VIIKSKNWKRAAWLGAASAFVMSLDFTTAVRAQSTLPAVTVDAPQQQATRRSQVKRSTSGARGDRRVAARRSQQAVAPGPVNPRPETAWGHVDGYVATRSGTGTKTDTPLIETPQAISVVTQDQIQAQAAQSVSQATRYTSGVVGERNGADGRFDQVYVRGFLADQYLDSLRVASGTFAYTLVDPFNLERLEVLHGPASVLYGQASPGGVVNMVSKRPTTEPYQEMFVSTGSYGRVQSGIDVSGPLDKNKEFLYRLTASGYDVGSQVDHGDYQRVSIAPSLTWRPTNDTTITFQGTYQRDPKAGFYNQLLPNGVGTLFSTVNGRIPTSFYLGDPNYNIFKREYGSIGYLFEHRFDNVWTVRQNLRYTDNSTYTQAVYPQSNQTNITSIGRDAFSAAETLRTFAIDNQAEAKFATGPFQHMTLFGVDYQTGTDRASNGYLADVGAINALNPVYGITVPALDFDGASRQTFDQVGVYLQDQIKFDRWVALLGVRHDRAESRTVSTFDGTTFGTTATSDEATTKRGALLYKFDNGVAPYIQYTESFQPIVGASNRTLNPFKPTTGQQKEFGVKYQPDEKMLLTFAAFDLKQQNVVMQDPNDIRNRVQAGEIRSRGIEIEGKVQVDRSLTLLGAYTYLDLVNTNSEPDTLGKRPIGVPRNAASLWADYTFRSGVLDGFGLAAGVRYFGETAGDSMNTYNVPGVTLFDAALHYDLAGLGPQFKGFKFQLNASNLFDKTYVRLCQDSGCYYGMRRDVIATLRYRW